MITSVDRKKSFMKSLDAIQKRNILFGIGKQTPEQIFEFAKLSEQRGNLSDAADFYDKSGRKEELKSLRQKTVAEGDVFLFLRITKLLGEELNESSLKECALKAESLGKNRFAIMAYERLGDTEKVEALKDKVSSDLDIVAEREAKSQVFIPTNNEELVDDEENSR
jgi:hypothetical protein